MFADLYLLAESPCGGVMSSSPCSEGGDTGNANHVVMSHIRNTELQEPSPCFYRSSPSSRALHRGQHAGQVATAIAAERSRVRYPEARSRDKQRPMIVPIARAGLVIRDPSV